MVREHVVRELILLMNRGPGTLQPSRATLKDGSSFEGIPFSSQMGSRHRAMVVQFTDNAEPFPRVVDSRSRLPRDQRATTESTEIHGKENPNQLPLSVSFPGATPARRVGSFRGYAFVMIFLAGVILLHAPRPRREGGQLRVHRGGTGRPLDETLMPVTSRAGARLPQTRHACPCFGRAVRARGEGGRTHHEGRAEPASVRLLKDFRSFRNSAGRFGKPRVESSMPTPALGIVGGIPGVREIGRGLVRNKVKRPRNSQESDFVP